MALEKLYDASPVWMQNLMCSVKGWLIQRRRYNKGFFEELRKLEQREYSQENELRNFLVSAKNIPAYQDLLTDEVLKGDVYEVISKMPVIDKQYVKAHIEELRNAACQEPQFLMQTSGTTGGGLVFPYTVKMENKHWAVWWRYRRSLGISLDMWCGWFGGKRMIAPNNKKGPFWRINRPGRQVMFSSAHLNRDTVKDYYDEIVGRGLTWLHGYPSHIAKFSALALDRGLAPIASVKFVTTGAEGVLDNQRSLMQQFFPNALIRQHYGLMEGVANISQTRKGEWIVDDDFAFVEFLPVDDKNPSLCRIVGTGFSNPAFPLIRYDTGDLATVEKGADGKVRVLSIDGRSSNVLKGPNGFEINEARLSIVLHDFNNIIEAQFHQRSLTDVELWIVRNSKYGEADEQQLRRNLAFNFDGSMVVTLKYVDSIKRTARGKLPLVVNEMDN
jgi:phenylacetate-CoA ligase